MVIESEHLSQESSTPASYFGGSRFKSQPQDWISLQTFVIFLNFLRHVM